MTSGDVVGELERLITLHGPPSFIRCDNGPEFIARATQRSLADAKDRNALHSALPGNWQNGFAELTAAFVS